MHSNLKANLNNRLSVEIFGKQISSPLIVGSGTLIETHSEIYPFLNAGAGAVVPRTTRKILERSSHPVPHLYQYGSKKFPAMVNAEWTGADIEYWRPFLSVMSGTQKIIMSVSGRDIKGCLEVCQELDKHSGWLYFEINVSCAHSNFEHGMITRSENHIKEIISRLKDAEINTPIALKLGHSDYILSLANVAKEAGADAIVAINTYGPVFDFTISEAGMPQPVVGIRGGKGGLSGAPIYPIALTDIAEIKRQIGITVIGCGGVVTAEDTIKMMMAGASAVQVYTAPHSRGINAPFYFSDTNTALLSYLDKYEIKNISDIINRALFILDQDTNLALKVPEVKEEICIGCDLCITTCLPQAITTKPAQGLNKVGHVIQIDPQECVGCGHCIPICPTFPKALSFQDEK